MNCDATRILGIPVSVISMTQAVAVISGWIQSRIDHYVCVRDVHGIMLAQKDRCLRDIHEMAGLVTPDGMPLVWVCWLRGHKKAGRVCGADLVAALCDRSQELGFRHFFYGGKPGVASRMAAHLKELYPRIQVAGCIAPPFRALTPDEDDNIVLEMAAARPNIIWIGLSTPKQELWMRDHVGRVPGATLIGVGAAFDFYAGDVRRAPKWMQRMGIEWLHRLHSEPRRLWRRYLILAPLFVVKLVAEKLGVAKSSA